MWKQMNDVSSLHHHLDSMQPYARQTMIVHQKKNESMTIQAGDNPVQQYSFPSFTNFKCINSEIVADFQIPLNETMITSLLHAAGPAHWPIQTLQHSKDH